ncbi:MAG: 30S ribosomal protein S20 [Candidatus Dojkabacteria bacterium]|nr:30S ribosomal protein S20 [Candidatus Dojkabacteria bacterium]
MANLKSAKKAIRQSKRKALRNLKQKTEMRKLIKEVRNLADKGETEKAMKKYSEATKSIDKAAKSKFIHKNTADRYKSRLAIHINKTAKDKK